MTKAEIMKYVDHTLLSQTATEADIKVVCTDAIKFGCASICIPNIHLRFAAEYVAGRVKVGTVIGFPLGYNCTEVKCFEAKHMLACGADEFDMVADICRIKEGRYDKVLDEIKAVKDVVGNHVLKVIVEACLLTEEEKIRMCHLISESGADYIKTSTGFSSGGATREDIATFAANVSGGLKIKAAGGIRSFSDAEDFIRLGALRLGTSALVKIMKKKSSALIEDTLMIIDFHVHCFPDSLAPRALSMLRDHAFENDRFPCTDGTVSGTEAHIKSLGVDRAVVCNIATNGRQQHKVNTFAISIAKNSKTLYSLGSLHPDGEDKKGELELLRKAGIRGIKLHPDYIGIDVNETAYNDIFELCSDMNFFVVLHAGLDPVSPEHIHASPRAILDIHTRFPKLRIIAAHMGGFRCSDETIECLLGKNIWFDTSMSSQRPNEVEKLRKILHEHDPNRLLFASDTPWAYETEELKFLYSAKLGDKLNERILSLNALQLLG